MIPWYQQGNVNVQTYGQPNYVLGNNLFKPEIPSTSVLPFLRSTTQDSTPYPTPYFLIEAQILHHPHPRTHDEVPLNEDHSQGHVVNGQTNPRVFPVVRFEPKQDAIILNKAMLGSGTNEAQIIKVITKRSLEQRLVIAEIYKEMFGCDIAREFKNETSGHFRRLLLALMTPLYQYYARELHEAMDGPGTDEDALMEILCTLSNTEMEHVKKAYSNMYRKHLEEHIRDETSGYFKELLISLADRSEDNDVNSLKAKEQARRLHRAGELRYGTDESEFISILSTQSFGQLNEIFFQYQAMTQHDIEDVIISEFSGHLKKALKAIVKVVRNKPLYFAECLYKAMKGAGTDDKKLIRIIVTRAELDLGDIAEAFRLKYGSHLEAYVKSDTSGDYQKALLSLLGSPYLRSRGHPELLLYNNSEKTNEIKSTTNDYNETKENEQTPTTKQVIPKKNRKKGAKRLKKLNHAKGLLAKLTDSNADGNTLIADTQKSSDDKPFISAKTSNKRKTNSTVIVKPKTKRYKSKTTKVSRNKKKDKIKNFSTIETRNSITQKSKRVAYTDYSYDF